MNADAGTATTRAAGPARQAGSLEAASAFVRAAGRVEVEAVALSQGRTQQLWRVDVTDESGRLIAHGEVRLQNVTGR